MLLRAALSPNKRFQFPQSSSYRSGFLLNKKFGGYFPPSVLCPNLMFLDGTIRCVGFCLVEFCLASLAGWRSCWPCQCYQGGRLHYPGGTVGFVKVIKAGVSITREVGLVSRPGS